MQKRKVLKLTEDGMHWAKWYIKYSGFMYYAGLRHIYLNTYKYTPYINPINDKKTPYFLRAADSGIPNPDMDNSEREG